MNRRKFLTGSTALVAAAATIPLDIAPKSLMEAYGGEVIPYPNIYGDAAFSARAWTRYPVSALWSQPIDVRTFDLLVGTGSIKV